MTLPPRLAAITAALPDAITASVFLYAWWTPASWHPGLIKTLMLVMLLEFIVVHANGFTMGALAGSRRTRRARAMVLVGAFAFYALFVAAFCIAFDAFWPVYAIAWLLLGKLAAVIGGVDDRARQRNARLWGVAVLCYVLGTFLTLMLPLPRFGITGNGAAYGIEGSGEWIDEPHTVIVFGLLYFGALAWYKWKTTPGLAPAPAPAG